MLTSLSSVPFVVLVRSAGEQRYTDRYFWATGRTLFTKDGVWGENGVVQDSMSDF